MKPDESIAMETKPETVTEAITEPVSEKKTRKSRKKISEAVKETEVILPEEVKAEPVKEEVPTKTELNPNEQAKYKAFQDIVRYEEYVREILTSKKMPTGKKVTKSDIAFMKKEYARLKDRYRELTNPSEKAMEQVPLANEA